MVVRSVRGSSGSKALDVGAAPEAAPDVAPGRAGSQKEKAASTDAVAGRAPGPVGGAKRAPADAVALPVVGGRPKAQTFEGTWKALEAAFAAAKPETLEAAIGVLGAHGFTVRKAEHGEVKLEHGGYSVKLESERMGELDAIHFKLEGPEKKGADDVDRRAVLMGGALVPKKLFAAMKDRYRGVLDDFEDALKDNGKKPLPTTFDALKRFIEAGRSDKVKAKDAVEDAEVAAKLDALTHKLEAMQAAGIAPKKLVVYTDGPDGAGKSSTGAIVLQSIAKTGYATDVAIFKAPTAEERQQHWLQRFRDKGVPAHEMEARFWDRGPAGDAVYGKKTPEQVKQMAKELRAFERELADEGVLLFKVHIFANQEKQADTFGKRLARQAAADVIEERLAKGGRLTDVASDALANIRAKIDGDDLRALVDFETHQAAFLRFSKAAGYTVVDASDRHAARLAIIDALSEQLDAWAARAA